MTTPTANAETMERVTMILRRDLRLGDDAVIGDETTLVGGAFDLDSLDVLMLVTSVEKEFGITIRDDAIGREAFTTVATLVRFVDEQAAGQPAPASLISNLPHCAPFLFLSQVGHFEAGCEASATWTVAGDEDFFTGHFPGQPLIPGVLLAEAMAQLSGLVVGEAQQHGTLARLDVRFTHSIAPPASVHLTSRLVRTLNELSLFDVEASVEGRVAASGSLALAMPGASDGR